MLSFLSNPLRMMLRHREILIRTVLSDLRQKYAGLVAGMVWMVLYPLLLMAFYSVIYMVVFKVRPVKLTQGEYVLYIFAGLIPFLGFVEALNAGTTSLSLNKAILLNTVFPSELVPVRAVIASQATTAFGLAMVIIAALILGKMSPTLLLAPLVLVLQMMFVAGIVWVLSLANLVLRDIQQILSFVTLSLLIITPIAYTPDMVPRALKLVIYLNPLSYFVMGFQDLIVFGRFPPLWAATVGVVLGLLSFALGFRVFQRMKQVMFDYV